jgi:hypothetical protein
MKLWLSRFKVLAVFVVARGFSYLYGTGWITKSKYMSSDRVVIAYSYSVFNDIGLEIAKNPVAKTRSVIGGNVSGCKKTSILIYTVI